MKRRKKRERTRTHFPQEKCQKGTPTVCYLLYTHYLGGFSQPELFLRACKREPKIGKLPKASKQKEQNPLAGWLESWSSGRTLWRKNTPVRRVSRQAFENELTVVKCRERARSFTSFLTWKSQPQMLRIPLSVCNCWDFPCSWISYKTNPGLRRDYRESQLWGADLCVASSEVSIEQTRSGKRVHLVKSLGDICQRR